MKRLLVVGWILALFTLCNGLALTAALQSLDYFPATITASSYLTCDWNKFEENYLPPYIMDGRKETAWVEDGQGSNASGTGEFIRFEGLLAKGVAELRLDILNGYQKSIYHYYANSRPRELAVYINLPLPTDESLSQAKPIAIIHLKDQMDWQSFTLPVQSDLKSITLKIISFYKGNKYTDTCISDIRFNVSATEGFDPALSRYNRERNGAFIKERLDKARNMGRLPKSGLVKQRYRRLAASTMQKLTVPTEIPEVFKKRYVNQNDEALILRLIWSGGDYSKRTGWSKEGIRRTIYDAMDQLKAYPKAWPFLPWLQNIQIDAVQPDQKPVRVYLINEKANNYDLPFESYSETGIGKTLHQNFLRCDSMKNNTVSLTYDDLNKKTTPDGPPMMPFHEYKVGFKLPVGDELWHGYAYSYYEVWACCCSGGPRWIDEVVLYNAQGVMCMKFQSDPSYGRSLKLLVWGKEPLQLDKGIVICDKIPGDELEDEKPGGMELWE
jgi:hypothetical protein